MIVDEDFVNYYKCSMFLAFPTCTWKCEGCQNKELAKLRNIVMGAHEIVDRYMRNYMSEAIVFGGLEPFDSNDLPPLVRAFRGFTDDPIIIYTGYWESEIQPRLTWLSQFKNIIVKFGRYIPDSDIFLDPILGVKLASVNQYARKIS